MRKQERTRRAECGDPASHASLDEHLAWLDAAVARLDRGIGDAAKASPALDQSVTLLRSAPGVGPVTATVLTATVLIATMPELGAVTPKAAAAPPTNPSGKPANRPKSPSSPSPANCSPSSRHPRQNRLHGITTQSPASARVKL